MLLFALLFATFDQINIKDWASETKLELALTSLEVSNFVILHVLAQWKIYYYSIEIKIFWGKHKVITLKQQFLGII